MARGGREEAFTECTEIHDQKREGGGGGLSYGHRGLVSVLPAPLQLEPTVTSCPAITKNYYNAFIVIHNA